MLSKLFGTPQDGDKGIALIPNTTKQNYAGPNAAQPRPPTTNAAQPPVPDIPAAQPPMPMPPVNAPANTTVNAALKATTTNSNAAMRRLAVPRPMNAYPLNARLNSANDDWHNRVRELQDQLSQYEAILERQKQNLTAAKVTMERQEQQMRRQQEEFERRLQRIAERKVDNNNNAFDDGHYRPRVVYRGPRGDHRHDDYDDPVPRRRPPALPHAPRRPPPPVANPKPAQQQASANSRSLPPRLHHHHNGQSLPTRNLLSGPDGGFLIRVPPTETKTHGDQLVYVDKRSILRAARKVQRTKDEVLDQEMDDLKAKVQTTGH